MEEDAGDEDEEKEKEEGTSGPDYNYLLSMPMWFLTKEKKDELCKQRDAKVTMTLTKRRSGSVPDVRVMFSFPPFFRSWVLVIDDRVERVEEEVSFRSVEGGSRCLY